MEAFPAAPSVWTRGDQEVSLARLYAMRAVGLLGIYGLLPTIGRLVDHSPTERGMLTAMVSGLWVMAFLIVRYPLKLVPLFLFEITWKLLWLIFFGLPQWWSGVGPPSLAQDLWSIGAFPIVCALVIPWGYVWRHYVKAPGDRWR
jgi:hypothetical protein